MNDDTKETVGVTIQYRDVMGQGSLLLTPEQLIEHTATCLAEIDGGREAVEVAIKAIRKTDADRWYGGWGRDQRLLWEDVLDDMPEDASG